MYDIDTKNVKSGKKLYYIIFLAGLFFACIIGFATFDSFISLITNPLSLIFFFLPLSFMILSIINIRRINRRVALINELNKKGKLIKNLSYHMENTGIVYNNIKIYEPVVDYVLPNGTKLIWHGDPRFDLKNSDADGMVDVVIDEDNPDNYFIDFEINRLSGNLPSDYYNNSMEQNNSIDEVNTEQSTDNILQ